MDNPGTGATACQPVRMKQPSAPLPVGALKLARDLKRRGIDPVKAGLQRVRRGVWVDKAAWEGLSPIHRHAAFVRATALLIDPEQQPIFCDTSAAALLGLPRIEPWPAVCEVLATGPRRGSDLIRPRVGAEVEPVEVDGIWVTPVDRTVVDLARAGSLETAVAAADHALRHEMCPRAALDAEVAAIPPRGRGRHRARLTVDLADPRSMSAGESLSRVGMFRLGLPRPDLQVEHRDDRGLIGRTDFAWGEVVGEFDGKIKYAIPDDADPATASEIVWREKQREDRLRRLPRRVARWVWADAITPERMARILATEGIRPVSPCTWFAVDPDTRPNIGA